MLSQQLLGKCKCVHFLTKSFYRDGLLHACFYIYLKESGTEHIRLHCSTAGTASAVDVSLDGSAFSFVSSVAGFVSSASGSAAVSSLTASSAGAVSSLTVSSLAASSVADSPVLAFFASGSGAGSSLSGEGLFSPTAAVVSSAAGVVSSG